MRKKITFLLTPYAEENCYKCIFCGHNLVAKAFSCVIKNEMKINKLFDFLTRIEPSP